MNRTWGKKDEDRLLRDSFGVNPPWIVFYLGQCFVKLLLWLMDNWMPAGLRVNQTVVGGRVLSHVITTMIELGVPEALGAGPLTIGELADAVGVPDAEGLSRVLRCAISFGYFGEVHKRGQPVRYCNNRLSAVLCEKHVQCQKDFILQCTTISGPCLQKLTPALRERRLAYKLLNGPDADFWEDLKANPENETTFSRAMACMESLTNGPLQQDIPWGRWGRVIDIGGAYGSVLAAVLTQHPGMRGVLFDQQQVVDRAQEVWKDSPSLSRLLERTQFVGGDFFDAGTLPRAEGPQDVYFMRSILHDWNDAHCKSILTALRGAIGDSGATVLTADPMPQEPTTCLANVGCLTSDILMMSVIDGKERTKQQMERVFADTGFDVVGIHKTRSFFTAVEARAAKPSTNSTPKKLT